MDNFQNIEKDLDTLSTVDEFLATESMRLLGQQAFIDFSNENNLLDICQKNKLRNLRKHILSLKNKTNI